jgi:hypothetical protein
MGAIVYKLKRRGKVHFFMVESSAVGEPRRAIQSLGLASYAKGDRKAGGKLEAIALDLQEELDNVAVVASAMLDAMKLIKPSEVSLEFGVELGGKARLFLVTEGSAKANVKVTVKWQPSERESISAQVAT